MQSNASNSSTLKQEPWVPTFEPDEERVMCDLPLGLRTLTNHTVDLLPISFPNRNILVLFFYALEVLLVGIVVWLFSPNTYNFLSEILQVFSLEILSYPLTALALVLAFDLAFGLIKMLLTWALVFRTSKKERERTALQALNYAKGYWNSDPTESIILCKNGKCPRDLADKAIDIVFCRKKLVSRFLDAAELLLSDRFLLRVDGYIYLSNYSDKGVATWIRIYQRSIENFAVSAVKATALRSFNNEYEAETISESEIEQKMRLWLSCGGLENRVDALEKKLNLNSSNMHC